MTDPVQQSHSANSDCHIAMKQFVFSTLLLAELCAAAALCASETTIPEDNPGREKLAAWIKENNTDPQLIQKCIASADDALMKNRDMELRIGPDLLKSQKPTSLWLVDEAFVPVEYSGELAAKAAIQPKQLSAHYFNQTESLHGYSIYELSDLKVDNAEHLPAGREITGSFSCKLMQKERRSYQVRFWIAGMKSSKVIPYDPRGALPKDGKFQFALNPVDNQKQLGLNNGEPTMLFVTISYLAVKHSTPLMVVCSNALGQVIAFDGK
jgi:hypothetical protein